jgi:phosphonate transport system substrate-binding protein
MKVLKLASCMAENTEALCSAVAEILEIESASRLNMSAAFPWQERGDYSTGEIQILWLCGLPYVNKADLADSGMELLAMPVPSGLRYHGRPVYYSDVVVRRDSPVNSFVDLRGAAFAYNEPRSHSGFNVVRAYLAEFGQRELLRQRRRTGAHARSVEMILSGSLIARGHRQHGIGVAPSLAAIWRMSCASSKPSTEPDPALGCFKNYPGLRRKSARSCYLH